MFVFKEFKNKYYKYLRNVSLGEDNIIASPDILEYNTSI